MKIVLNQVVLAAPASVDSTCHILKDSKCIPQKLHALAVQSGRSFREVTSKPVHICLVWFAAHVVPSSTCKIAVSAWAGTCIQSPPGSKCELASHGSGSKSHEAGAKSLAYTCLHLNYQLIFHLQKPTHTSPNNCFCRKECSNCQFTQHQIAVTNPVALWMGRSRRSFQRQNRCHPSDTAIYTNPDGVTSDLVSKGSQDVHWKLLSTRIPRKYARSSCPDWEKLSRSDRQAGPYLPALVCSPCCSLQHLQNCCLATKTSFWVGVYSKCRLASQRKWFRSIYSFKDNACGSIFYAGIAYQS